MCAPPHCDLRPKPLLSYTSRMQSPAEHPIALAVRGLTKRFDRPAVDGLDLTVRAGEFYALLGPNGAGKTTTLRMVAGLLRPDAGSISVFGIDALADPVAAKRIMAWVSDEPMIYDKLTPFEYLEFVAGLWGIDAAHRRGARRRADRLARPRRRTRTSAARASPRACGRRWRSPARWCTTRALIILDEPLTGLDAGSRASGQERAARARRRRRHRDHDDAHPRSRRAHGRPHRRHRRRPADRRGHARRTARHRPASRDASLEDTFLTLVAEQARRREPRPASLTWLAQPRVPARRGATGGR